MLLEIITPEKTVLKEDVDEIRVPTAKGQIGILPHHTNMVTNLDAGELIMKNKGKEAVYAVTGGFLQVYNNTVTVMADYAAYVEDIDIEQAIAAQKRAEEILKKGKEQVSEQDFAIAEAELRKSILNINIGRRRKRNV